MDLAGPEALESLHLPTGIDMADDSADSAGVAVPPPLVYAVGFGIGYALHRLKPAPVGVDGRAWTLLGWVLIGAGVALAASAVVLFRRAGTSPVPIQPSTALVVRGPYRFTRNPMYVGLAALYAGVALLVNSLWPLAVLPLVLSVIRWRVIAREEAYLERTFGEEYRAYKARVRRWV
jgi:protein-S-isoprenylcysteine O-methyltransferase Ste14